MKIRRLLLLLSAIILCSPAFLFAETIVLKSGQKVEGKILERETKYVKIDFHGVPIKYDMKDIESINGDLVGMAEKNETALPQMPQKIAVSRLQAPNVINWQNNLDEALNMARRDEKPLMVDFYTDWCGWCKKLESDTYSNETIRMLSEQFVCVKINADNNRSAVEHYNVHGYPSIIFLSHNDDILNTSFGYVDVSALAGMIKGVLKKYPNEKTENLLQLINALPKSQAHDDAQKGVPSGILAIAFGLTIISYIYFSVCLMLIAKKANIGYPWLAWIPIANIFLIFSIAGISYWIILLMIFVFFIPIIGAISYAIFAIYLWYQIAVAVYKPGWIGVLAVIPIVGYVAMGYLAFSKTVDPA